MKTSKTLTTALLLCGLGAASHTANASRVDIPDHEKQPEPYVLNMSDGFQDAEYIMGVFRQTQVLRITEAGSYELTLTDVSKDHALKALDATLASRQGGMLERLSGNGSMIFDLEPGLYRLTYFAKTGHPKLSGKFTISLLPEDITPEPVPVPAAVWFLGSGLLALGGLLRRRQIP